MVTVHGTTEQADVSLHWAGGFTSRHELLRPVRRYQQIADYERLMARIEELETRGKCYSEIAQHLNQDGFRPAKQARQFNKTIVGRLVKKLRRDRPVVRRNIPHEHLEENEWSVNDLANRLDIPRTTLISWIKRGWIHVSRQLPGYRGRIICWANAGELDRLRQLRQTKHQSGDPPLPQALMIPNTPPSRCT
jgi:hypothetical protein